MRKFLTFGVLLLAFLFFSVQTFSQNDTPVNGRTNYEMRESEHPEKKNITLPDTWESDEVIISHMDLGSRFYGKNVFQADIQNKNEKIIYVTLDLRSEPRDGFTRNWQKQFIYMLHPGQKKKTTAEYELLLINDESTVRVTFNILAAENNEIAQKRLFRKMYNKLELMGEKTRAQKQGVFTVSDIKMDDFCWGLNKFSIKVKNNTDSIQYLSTFTHTAYPNSSKPRTKAGIYDAYEFGPKQEKTVEGEYFIMPEHGTCVITVIVNSMLDEPETVFDWAIEIKKQSFSAEFSFPNKKINEIKMPQRNLEQFRFPQESLMPALPPFEQKETEHFVFYYFPRTLAEKDMDRIVLERETALNRISRMIGVDYEGKIFVFFYPDAESKLKVVQHQGAGLAYGSTLVEIYNEKTKVDPNHEICHVVTNLLGDPPALFDEGFATYNQKDHIWGGQHIDIWAKDYKKKNTLWKIEDIFAFTDIGSGATKPMIAYPQAASMVKYIIDKYGIEKFTEIFRTLKRSNDPEQIETNKREFKRILGIDILTFENQWLNQLDKTEFNQTG